MTSHSPTSFRLLKGVATILGSMALWGCEITNYPAPLQPAATPTTGDEIASVSEESRSLQEHYQRVENGLVSRGLLRTDGGGADTPYDASTLARNFAEIALAEEHVLSNGRLLPGRSGTKVNRWNKPVRVSLSFAPTVSDDQRITDKTTVTRFVQRLSALTGHPIYSVAGPARNANFNIVVLHEDQRRDFANAVAALDVPLPPEIIQPISSLRTSDDCVVITWDENESGEISRTFVFIRAELPDLMRKSCFHEEIAQGLGLFNDFPRARPSVFNDDDEFALLTSHDELLLKMLYDRRMRPGLDASEAQSVAALIAEELLGGTNG